MERLYSTGSLARKLSISHGSVHQLVRSGKATAFRNSVGHYVFTESEVARLVKVRAKRTAEIEAQRAGMDQ